jgi:hypothetical protein
VFRSARGWGKKQTGPEPPDFHRAVQIPSARILRGPFVQISTHFLEIVLTWDVCRVNQRVIRVDERGIHTDALRIHMDAKLIQMDGVLIHTDDARAGPDATRIHTDGVLIHTDAAPVEPDDTRVRLDVTPVKPDDERVRPDARPIRPAAPRVRPLSAEPPNRRLFHFSPVSPMSTATSRPGTRMLNSAKPTARY